MPILPTDPLPENINDIVWQANCLWTEHLHDRAEKKRLGPDTAPPKDRLMDLLLRVTEERPEHGRNPDLLCLVGEIHKENGNNALANKSFRAAADIFKTAGKDVHYQQALAGVYETEENDSHIITARSLLAKNYMLPASIMASYMTGKRILTNDEHSKKLVELLQPLGIPPAKRSPEEIEQEQKQIARAQRSWRRGATFQQRQPKPQQPIPQPSAKPSIYRSPGSCTLEEQLDFKRNQDLSRRP